MNYYYFARVKNAFPLGGKKSKEKKILDAAQLK